MLTTELPYAGRQRLQHDAVEGQRGSAAADASFVPDLDPHLEEIVLHAIERLPANRYGSAAEMLQPSSRTRRRS